MSQLSKTEISKGCTLPESKTASLVKRNKRVYCICQTSDTSGLMIECDGCEDWYHCDCVGVTRKQSKLIKLYFCDKCKAKDPSLKIELKTALTRNEFKEKNYTLVDTKRGDRKKPCPQKKSCNNCDNCKRTKNCGLCLGCCKMRRFGGSDLCENRMCLNIIIQGSKFLCKSKTKSELYSSSEDEYAPLINDGQCYGPKCTQKARVNSKYCSDECGVKLASNRIFYILPARVAEWGLSPCIAEETNKKQLEEVRKKESQVRDVLKALEEKLKVLDDILEKSKLLTIDLNQVVPNENEDMSMYCVTCGHEIHTRTAIKHMEKCFNKYESQSVIDSLYKTQIDGNNMFCDFYKPSERTYCKQLRVLCPIHNKNSTVISNTEVCGCPLNSNVFNYTGEFCRLPKKSCINHYCWEKLKRAEIDMERVRQWSKLDELIEKERQIRQSMSLRAGVLPLMLHSTYDHEANKCLANGNNFRYHGENNSGNHST